MASTIFELDGIACLDPELLAEECERIDARSDWVGKPNSFRSPRGSDYGRGWVLLYAEDLQRLTVDSEVGAQHNLRIAISGDGQGTNPQQVVISGLTILWAEAVVSGGTITAGTPYLVHLVDKRWYGQFSTVNQQYNVRTPEATLGTVATADTNYFPYTLKGGIGGTAWTWQELFENL